MKVVLISTHGTNIGDDLIRRGVQRLLTSALRGRDLQWKIVNKHKPGQVYGGAAGLVGLLPRGQQKTLRGVGRVHRALGLPTVFTGAELVVQCGTPVMWPGVHRSEWQGPIWDDALARRGRPPVLNLSGGSCYPWTAPRPAELEPADEAALRRMFADCDLFTARDHEARRVAESLGTPAEVFPCAAMHSGDGDVATGGSQTLILNVMPRGGHFDWDQDLDPRRWLTAMDEVVAKRSRTDRILFLCHCADELELANTRWPEHQAVLPTSTQEYHDVARRGRIALVNRMHAAVALAGLGVPALAVGTDTRLLMVAQAGQEISYLGDASAGRMLETLDLLDAEFEARRKSLISTQEESFAAHRDVIMNCDVVSHRLL